MIVPLWASELARNFWKTAGGPEPFPRTLRSALSRSPLQLTVKELPALCLHGVGHYLGAQGVTWSCLGPDRRLRACLSAAKGVGFILLDADDEPAERRVSLAHELAHFLRHYLQPRHLAGARLGAGIAEVIDGHRPPTPAERARALLANVPLGLHVHLMERGPARGALRADVAAAEEEADQLAYELLAPAEAIFARTGPANADTRAQVAQLLQADFGLPRACAADYAALLLPTAWRDPLLRGFSFQS